jgi:hypothetical protein
MDEIIKKYLKQMLMLNYAMGAGRGRFDNVLDTLLFGKEEERIAEVNKYIKEEVLPQKEGEVSRIQADAAKLTEKEAEVASLNNLVK